MTARGRSSSRVGSDPTRGQPYAEGMRRHLISHPFRLAAALVVAAAFVLVPGSPAASTPTTVSVNVNAGAMTVNGTVIDFAENPAALLNGTYDPATGAFSGTLAIPSFGQTDDTSVGEGFALSFADTSAPVTGTIPQTGSGTLGTVGFTVGVDLIGPSDIISGCSVVIAPMSFTTTFDATAGTLTLTSTGFTIPGVTCTGGAGDEGTVNAVLAIPTTLTSLVLSSSAASALRAPQEPTRPSYTG